jgi:hypothetical protein
MSTQNYPPFELAFSEAANRAVREGLITTSRDAELRRSYADDLCFNLLRRDGSVIARYQKEELYASLAGYSSTAIPVNTRDRAARWAESMGYSVPTRLNGCLSAILVIVGLCIYIVPGFLVLIWLWWQSSRYETEMNKIVGRWNDAGRPEPGHQQKAVVVLDNNERPFAKDVEERLNEIEALKKKSLISEEEYISLRRKELGL